MLDDSLFADFGGGAVLWGGAGFWGGAVVLVDRFCRCAVAGVDTTGDRIAAKDNHQGSSEKFSCWNVVCLVVCHISIHQGQLLSQPTHV